MSGPLTLFEDLFHQSSLDPAVAAAVTVLCSALPPTPLPSGLDQALRAVAPHLSDSERASWAAVLVTPLLKAGIAAPRCVAAFLGQCAHESAGFRALEEDLSYSAARLCQVWPNRFPTAQAAEACALQPELLANRVYAERLGNGGEDTGDGWRFRGRGLIQITGRTAYQRFAKSMGMTLDQAVEHAATEAGAADSAAWFWTANDLNGLAKTWSIDLLTRKINGGMAGAAERTRLCEAALHVFGA
jgi:putative chitinase